MAFFIPLALLAASIFTQHQFRVLVEIGPSVQQYVVIVADTRANAKLIASAQYGAKNIKDIAEIR